MAKVFSMLLLVGVLLGCTTNSPRVMNTIDITKSDLTDSRIQKSKDCTYYVLGFVGPFGDRSVIDATRKKYIKDIQYVDYSFGYFILWSQSCIEVYGK